MELFAASQALEFKLPLKPGAGSKIAYNLVREVVPFLTEDTVLYKEFEKIEQQTDTIIKEIEKSVGEITV